MRGPAACPAQRAPQCVLAARAAPCADMLTCDDLRHTHSTHGAWCWVLLQALDDDVTCSVQEYTGSGSTTSYSLTTVGMSV
jgi:hypothetical protein